MKHAILSVAVGWMVASWCALPAAFAKEPACHAEMDKFCKDVQPGAARMVNCLRQHDADLSKQCRAYVNTALQYMACIDDATRLCPRMEPGGGRVTACLRAHQGALSEECKYELQRTMGR